MPGIKNTVIGPKSRVLVTVTKKGREEQFTATVIGWNANGTLKVNSDRAGEKQRIKNISSNNVKLIKQ